MTCPLLYRYRTIDRLPEPPSEAATRGTLVHAVLERLFDLPAPERTPGAAAELLEPEWEAMLAAEPELARLFDAASPDAGAPGADVEGAGSAGAGAGDGARGTIDSGVRGAEPASWLRGAQQLLERWFTLEDPTRLEPAERELYVEAPLDSGLVLRGYVDRLDVSPAGDLRVVDYKTGRSPGAGFEGRALFQMRFYALVLWRLRGRVPAVLQLVYLGDGQIIRYSPDADELRATERKVQALWQAISAARVSGDWRPRRNRLCGWCSFQSLCPEWGGTPPPLPSVTTAA